MTVQDIVSQLNLTVCSGQEGLQREVKGGYTSDLLSDVMGHAQEGDVWVTLQTHKNVMAIASLKEIRRHSGERTRSGRRHPGRKQ